MTHSSLDSSSYFVGIDVAKAKLDLARTDDGKILAFNNDPDGIRQIVSSLRTSPPIRIVIESTGGLERPLLEALLDADLPVALVNPKNVRHFAIGIGILAKSDPIDAYVLSVFAKLANPRLAEKRSANQVELDALVTCRRQLVGLRATQLNQRATTSSKAAIKTIDAVMRDIGKEIKKLDKKIRTLVESDDDRQASALVGIAPYNHDSGTMKGARSIRGGRESVRSALYMTAVTAIRCNPVIKAFAGKLDKRGKAKKVQIVACMRKLLGFLNVMLRDRLTWNQLSVVKALAI